MLSKGGSRRGKHATGSRPRLHGSRPDMQKQAWPRYVGQKCADVTLQHPLKVGQYCLVSYLFIYFMIWTPCLGSSSCFCMTKQRPTDGLRGFVFLEKPSKIHNQKQQST